MKKRILLSLALAQFALASALSAAEVVYEAETQTWNDGVASSFNAGYTGTGYVDLTNIVGPYLDFTVSVPVAGTYQLSVRYSNGTELARPMSMKVNGVASSIAWPFAPTGPWTSWTKQSNAVALKAGNNTVRFTATAAAGAPNLDSLTVGAKLLTEAETQTWSTGVQETVNAGYSGASYVNLDNAAGTWIEFKIIAPVAGSYNLKFRYANGTSLNRPMDMSVNGEFRLPVWDFVSTSSWTNWKELNKNVSLEAGLNTFRLIANDSAGAPNLDLLTVK